MRRVSQISSTPTWETAIRSNELKYWHYRLVRDFIVRFDLPLKAPDALHLALCAVESLILFTADRQLARDAESLGVRTELVGRQELPTTPETRCP